MLKCWRRSWTIFNNSFPQVGRYSPTYGRSIDTRFQESHIRHQAQLILCLYKSYFFTYIITTLWLTNHNEENGWWRVLFSVVANRIKSNWKCLRWKKVWVYLVSSGTFLSGREFYLQPVLLTRTNYLTKNHYYWMIMKLTIRDKKADIFDAYQQQQKQIEETCEQTKILFGVCFVLLAFHLIWLWITKHL